MPSIHLPFRNASASITCAPGGTAAPMGIVAVPSERNAGPAKPITPVPTPKSVSKMLPSASKTIAFSPRGAVAPPYGPR
jgi:hypothetical protein